MGKRALYFIAWAVVFTAIGGCHPIKDLQQPDTAMPDSYTDSTATVSSASYADNDWRRVFDDQTLCGLIEKALVHNHDILKAAARVDEVRELYGISKSDYYPTVDATVRGERETKWYHDGSTPDGNYSPDPQVGIKVHIGWEYNLMGKLNYARRQAEADFKATLDDQQAMRMTVIAQVASAYYQLLAQETAIGITRRTLPTREESVKKAKLRFEAGLTSELVYLQARTEYISTQSLIPELNRQAEILRTALSILTGEYPTAVNDARTINLSDVLPPKLPLGVPSQLLQRRPDLRASEQRLNAAAQAVGVAYADRFPSIRLDFTAGFWNSRFPELFKSAYYYPIGAVGGSLLDFGRKKRQHKAAVARYEQSRIQYEQDLLRAFGEVRDASVNYQQAHASADSKKELTVAAGQYLRLAVMQYHAGTLSYLDVLDAQRRLFDAEIGLSNAIRDEYLAMIELYKALGGGWN